MDDGLVDRIRRRAGVAELREALADRLPASQLQSLMLDVYRRRAAAVTAPQVLRSYQRNRYVGPSALSPLATAAVERLALLAAADGGFDAVTLSPVSPFGTTAAVAPVHQDKVISAVRGVEVAADTTNVLALECATRRQHATRETGPVRLCAVQRVVRGQPFEMPGALQHFGLFGLCTAGRDEGSYRFEVASLVSQLTVHMRLIRHCVASGYPVADIRVWLTEYGDPRRRDALARQVVAPLAEEFPEARFGFDDGRTAGRGYYSAVSLRVDVTTPSGQECNLADGGFTTWTRQLLGNRKERLLISGLGTDRLCATFGDAAGHPL